MCVFLESAAQGQMNREERVEVGAYLTLGTEGHDVAEKTSWTTFGLVGGYVDFSAKRMRLGLDLRSNGTSATLSGLLVGPRVAASYKILNFYAEGLFGPNHLNPGQVHGVTSELVVGLEEGLSRHWRWRMLEFTDGRFDGVEHSRPRSLTTGLVLHLP